jgi:hypothetical protein
MWQRITELSSAGRSVSSLEVFPLLHQVPDFPHQGLMAGDCGFCDRAIVVKPWNRHSGLEILNCPLALSNEGLQLRDPPRPCLTLAPPAALVSFRPLFFLVTEFRWAGRD